MYKRSTILALLLALCGVIGAQTYSAPAAKSKAKPAKSEAAAPAEKAAPAEGAEKAKPAMKEESKMQAAGDIQFSPGPAGLPEGTQIAVLRGNPGAAGPFIIRLKFPDGLVVAPHWHPSAEYVTIISGEFKVGMGKEVDESKMNSAMPGDFATLAAHSPHYVKSVGESVVQIASTGPFKITYVKAEDDPRKKK